jgi:hypothetical protein
MVPAVTVLVVGFVYFCIVFTSPGIRWVAQNLFSGAAAGQGFIQRFPHGGKWLFPVSGVSRAVVG